MASSLPYLYHHLKIGNQFLQGRAWSPELLENERDALIIISQSTTIRVPKFLHFSVGCGTIEAVDGLFGK